MAVSKLVSYSLGDAIDWKRVIIDFLIAEWDIPLLARGRDRLETSTPLSQSQSGNIFSYSLGDAIDWKQVQEKVLGALRCFSLLARGRDRLETSCQLSLAVYMLFPLLARGRDRLETELPL